MSGLRGFAGENEIVLTIAIASIQNGRNFTEVKSSHPGRRPQRSYGYRSSCGTHWSSHPHCPTERCGLKASPERFLKGRSKVRQCVGVRSCVRWCSPSALYQDKNPVAIGGVTRFFGSDLRWENQTSKNCTTNARCLE